MITCGDKVATRRLIRKGALLLIASTTLYHLLYHLEDSHVTTALFAPSALPPVLADPAAAALDTVFAQPPVLTDAFAAALLAVAALPAVLADAAAAAVFAIAALPPVLAEAAAAALLAQVLRRRPCSQRPLPPHSLQK